MCRPIVTYGVPTKHFRGIVLLDEINGFLNRGDLEKT